MPREFQCQCGRKFRVRDDYAGKKARCPECAAVVRVPDLEPPATVAVPPPAPAPAPAAIPTVAPVPIPPPLGRKAESEAAEGPALDLAALNLRIEPESEPPPRGAAAVVPEAAPIEAEPAGSSGRGRDRRAARAATAPVPATGLRTEPWFYQVLHLAALIVVGLAALQFTVVLGLVLGGLAGRGPLAPLPLPDGSPRASELWGLISGLVSSGVVLAVALLLTAPVFLLVDVARNIRRSTGALLAMADAQGR